MLIHVGKGLTLVPAVTTPPMTVSVCQVGEVPKRLAFHGECVQVLLVTSVVLLARTDVASLDVASCFHDELILSETCERWAYRAAAGFEGVKPLTLGERTRWYIL